MSFWHFRSSLMNENPKKIWGKKTRTIKSHLTWWLLCTFQEKREEISHSFMQGPWSNSQTVAQRTWSLETPKFTSVERKRYSRSMNIHILFFHLYIEPSLFSRSPEDSAVLDVSLLRKTKVLIYINNNKFIDTRDTKWCTYIKWQF